MSVDLLRRAAEELRAQANKAQHAEPWCPNYTWSAVRHVQRNVDLDLDCADHPNGGCPSFDMYDGHYVALMHPPVALAVAAVLDRVVETFEDDHSQSIEAQIRLREAYAEELALARAILREQP